jgi:hypothetical protein
VERGAPWGRPFKIKRKPLTLKGTEAFNILKIVDKDLFLVNSLRIKKANVAALKKILGTDHHHLL